MRFPLRGEAAGTREAAVRRRSKVKIGMKRPAVDRAFDFIEEMTCNVAGIGGLYIVSLLGKTYP